MPPPPPPLLSADAPQQQQQQQQQEEEEEVEQVLKSSALVSSCKTIGQLLLVGILTQIFLFFLSGIAIKDSARLSYLEYLRYSFAFQESGWNQLGDLVLLQLTNALFFYSAARLIQHSHAFRSSWLASRFTVLTIIVSSTAFVAFKLYLLLSSGSSSPAQNYPVYPMFVYSILGVSVITVLIQLQWLLLSSGDWIAGFDYAKVGDEERASTRRRPSTAANSTSGDAETESPTELLKQVSLARLFSLIIPDWKLVAFGMIMLLINSATALALPYLFGKVVDQVSKENASPEQLTEIISQVFIILIVGGFSGYVRSYCFTLSGYLIVKRLRSDVFRAIILQEVAFFDTINTGDLLSRLSADPQALQHGVTVNVSMLLRGLVQAIGALVIMLGLSWKLTLVMFSSVPIVIVIAVVYGNYVSDLQEVFQTRLADAGSIAQEVISQIRTVRSFAKEDYSSAKYARAIDETHKIGVRVAQYNAIFMGAIGFFPQAAIALVLYYGGMLMMRGEMTGGLLTSFLLYTTTLAMSMAMLSGLWGDFMQTLGSSKKIFDLMDNRIPKIPISGGITLSNFQGRITFKEIEFTYPSRPQVQVLKGLSLELEPGAVLALVGPSGQGKSTVMSMLLRFYDPDKGYILLDNRLDLRSADPMWYRREIGYVSQEPVLFTGTIGENISYGWAGSSNYYSTGSSSGSLNNASHDSNSLNNNSNSASQQDIITAAKKANAHDFIMQFPKGYDTKVGERGVMLSGGQKQRIAIARAFLLNPKILLLDEATSALDAESESLVQEAIDRAMVGRTVVVVAHRLSTVVNAHKIAVISDGRVSEIGSHAQLMAMPAESGGLYRRLVNKQMHGSGGIGLK